MSRSLKKGPFVDEKLMKKVLKAKESKDLTPIKTWSRSSTIVPEMVGLKFSVHNGKDFILVDIIENRVGHKLGEFSHTRKFHRHGGKMQKEQEAAAAAAAQATPAPAKEESKK